MDSPLVLVGPPKPGRFIRPVPARPCLLGRSSGCDLIVDDQSVSRWHARLSRCGDGVRVADLCSRNGTFVDDMPIREAEVICGRRLRFGDVPLLLTTRDELYWELDGTVGDGGTPAGHRRSPVAPAGPHLTGAQHEVFDLLVQGLSEKVIARRLKVSGHTVHNHVGAIYKTFRVHSRPELLAFVLRQRVLAVATDAAAPGEGPRPTGPVVTEGPAAVLRLFYLTPAERDDYTQVLDGLGVAYRDAGGHLQVDGPVTPASVRAVAAAFRTSLRLA